MSRGGCIPLLEGKIEDCYKNGKIETKDCVYHKEHFKNLKAIIISELGLEMASVSELLDSFNDFKWLTGFYPLLLVIKLLNQEDEYVNEFHASTSESNLNLVDKLKIPYVIIATRAYQGLRLQLGRAMDSKKASDTYNFSVHLGLCLLYLMSRENTPKSQYGDEFIKLSYEVNKIDPINILGENIILNYSAISLKGHYMKT